MKDCKPVYKNNPNEIIDYIIWSIYIASRLD